MSPPVIQVQNIRLSVFQYLSVHNQKSVFEPGGDREFSLHHLDIDLPAVPDILGPVVRDVEVERPVAIDVRQSQRDAAILAFGPRRPGRIGESAVTIVQKAKHPIAGGRHQQVQAAIAVNIGEDRSPAKPVGADDAGFLRDILEFHVAKVFEERISPVQAAKVEVRPAVAIEVTHRHAGAVEKNPIRLAGPLIQGIGKIDSGLFGRQQRESGFPAPGNFQVSPSESSCFVPPSFAAEQLGNPDT